MMAYNTIKVCMITLFVYSLLFTPCISQKQDEPSLKPIEKVPSQETTIQSIESNPSPIALPKALPTNEICPSPNLTDDAISLQKAMAGFGTDVFTIIELIALRTNAQRQEIRKEFNRIYEKNLLEELESELSGNLQTTVISLILTNVEFYAKELYDAMNGFGTDDEAISEILGSLDSEEIKEIASVYEKGYKTKLKDDINKDTSGSFRKLLELLCDAKRPTDSKNIKTVDVDTDTHELIIAGYSSRIKDTNEEEEQKLISILTSRSFSHLKLIFEKYYELKKRNFVQSIGNQYSSSLQNAFLKIILRAISKYEYYAKLLNNAMAGLGTNDRQLIRIIVGRSEKDLDYIKKSYETSYNTSLIDAVSDETSGEYRNLLMAILRK